LEKGLISILLRFETPAVICYRYSHWVTKLHIPVVKQLLMITVLIWQRLNQMFLGIFISPDAEIGPGFVVHTPFGINVGPAKIGANCTVSTGTLIGSGCRSVGDNVYFGAGCKIIGDLKIGSNVVIVANSVVLTDVPDNITIMGVPARIRIPGGRPKRFAWRTAEDEKIAKGANGKANGSAESAKGQKDAGAAGAPPVKNDGASSPGTHV